MSASFGFIVTEIERPREPVGPDPFIAEFEREVEHVTGRPEPRARHPLAPGSAWPVARESNGRSHGSGEEGEVPTPPRGADPSWRHGRRAPR